MTLPKLNFHILTALGLSNEIAEIVIDRISELESALAAKDEAVRAMLADPVALRANILRYGPAGFDLYSAEHIERIKSEAVSQVERKLNDALAELYRYQRIERGETPPP